jgi:hypothetical protein
MSNSVSTFQILSEKLPTTHPALLLGPLAIAAWMLAPGFAPEIGIPATTANPLHAAWNAARGALTGDKTASSFPATNTGDPASAAPVGGATTVVETPNSPPQVIVVPAGGQPSGVAPASYAGGPSGTSSGTQPAAGQSSKPARPQASAQRQQPVRTATPHASAPSVRPTPAQTAPPVVMTRPQFIRPPIIFVRPLFPPMPRFGYGRPMMGRAFVGGFGGRRR